VTQEVECVGHSLVGISWEFENIEMINCFHNDYKWKNSNCEVASLITLLSPVLSNLN